MKNQSLHSIRDFFDLKVSYPGFGRGRRSSPYPECTFFVKIHILLILLICVVDPLILWEEGHSLNLHGCDGDVWKSLREQVQAGFTRLEFNKGSRLQLVSWSYLHSGDFSEPIPYIRIIQLMEEQAYVLKRHNLWWLVMDGDLNHIGDGIVQVRGWLGFVRCVFHNTRSWNSNEIRYF